MGAVSILVTVTFTQFVARTTGTNLTLRARDVLQGWRIPLYIASGVWEILVVLAKDLLHIQEPENRFRVCGFDSSKHDPVRIGRTTLAVAYTTAAPNFIVIGIDPSQSRMLFHQISATGVQRMAKKLGARG